MFLHFQVGVCFITTVLSPPEDTLTDLKEWNWLLPICSLNEVGTHNPGLSPDRESNLQPFGVEADAPTEPPGQDNISSLLWLSSILLYIFYAV